jgi:predicted NBD/HSP70 family sugar kinase
VIVNGKKQRARLRIGVDLGGTKIECVVLASGGAELWRKRIPAPRGDCAETIKVVANLVQEAERVADMKCSVGIGTPGAISAASGLMKNCNSVWLNGMPFKRDLETALDREVRIANDANCFALSEAVDGAAQDAQIVFGVILGTGVGGAIVVDGQVLDGCNSITGEWGHNPLPWPRDVELPGPACYCGKSGCVETFLSGPGIVDDYIRSQGLESHRSQNHGLQNDGLKRSGAQNHGPRDAGSENRVPNGLGSPIGARDVFAYAEAGEPDALACVERYVDRLARALAHVINIVDPHVIVLGGGVSNVARIYNDVTRLWGRYIFSDSVATRLLRNIHGDASGVRGAAWLW